MSSQKHDRAILISKIFTIKVCKVTNIYGIALDIIYGREGIANGGSAKQNCFRRINA